MAITKNTAVDKAFAKQRHRPSLSEDAWQGLPVDSQLIAFGERFTFTFARGHEVGSIHFDRSRGEIFYKGHNIRNMALEEWQMRVIEGLKKTLSQDKKGKAFAAEYARTLEKIAVEKKNRHAGNH